MRRTLRWVLVLFGTLATGGARATPSSGFAGATIALGRFDDIDVMIHELLPAGAAPDDRRDEGRDEGRTLWLSFQKTRGPSDLYVQSNVWAVGGTTGWHTHPGHSLITVTAGAVTVYEGDDPSCTPHVYTAGMGFVDRGGDHVHVIRNEGAVEARTIAVQLIPAKAQRRIDAPGPSSCGF
jgi:hypothetical protein